MINTLKVKARMVEYGKTQKDIGQELGIAAATVSQKLNNVRPMDLDEAEKLCEILQIDAGQFGEYFFAHQVAQCNS
jgi:transcriptional regulator with XRE-family HTH domain